MKITSFLRSAFRMAAVFIVAGACADHTALGPSRIAAEESELLGGILDPVLGLLIPAKAVSRVTPLAHDIKVSKTIGSNGGYLEIPQAGFRIDVPRGAVRKNTVFTATAVAGYVIAYEFTPEGAQFSKELTITQSLHGTDWHKKGFKNAKGGYFSDRDLIDQLLRVVLTLELLPARVTPSNSIKFNVKHFSGYMVAGI